jgi:hypothetical protein
VVHFALPYGNEFEILISKVFVHNSLIYANINNIVEKSEQWNLSNYFHLICPEVSLFNMGNEDIQWIGLSPVSQSSFNKVMRNQFLDVAIMKKNLFASVMIVFQS